MFACPPGYDDHQQLDTAGKVLTGVMILAFVGNIILTFMSTGQA